MTFVAEGSASIAGLVGAYLGFALEMSHTYGRLTGLVVDKQWRGRGIGRKLMQYVETQLQHRGASVLIFTSGKHREEAHRFDRNIGYQETDLRLLKTCKIKFNKTYSQD